MAHRSTRSTGVEDALAEVRHQVERAQALSGPEFDPVALDITLLLYRVLGHYSRMHAAELAPYRLPVDQFNVLTVLQRSDRPLTMREVSRAVSVRPARLTIVVDRLCERDLVARAANPVDRRSFHLVLTPRGRELLDKILPRHWLMLRRLVAGLSQSEQLDLVDTLRKWYASVSAARSVEAAPKTEAPSPNGQAPRDE